MPQKKKKQKKLLVHATTRHWLIADAPSLRKLAMVQLGVAINVPPPTSNPLNASGTISNCCQNPSVQAWLTDGNGDKIFGTVQLSGGPPPTNWSAVFPDLPPGEYTLTVQVQCSNQIVNQTMDVNLQ